MQVLNVSPTSPVELPSSGSTATAADSGDGFSQVLARQQSEQSAGAAGSGQPSGAEASPSSSTPANGSETAADTQVDSQAGNGEAAAPADSTSQAAFSPLADMVRELTAHSRAVAADSLERAAAAQAGRNADKGLLDRAGRPARDGEATGELAIAVDSALVQIEADGAGKPEAESGDTTDVLPHEALALVSPSVDGRAPMAASRTRTADAALPGTQAASPLSLQATPDEPALSAQPGGVRDASPRLATDAPAARNVGLPTRADALASPRAAGPQVMDGRSLPGNAFDSSFTNALAGAQPGDAMPALSPVSALAPAVMPAMASPGSVLTGSIPVPLGSPQWAPAFSEQMVQIGTQQGGALHHAELRLDPPDLGPLRVSISLQGEHATATFVSPHASVRSAVEAALPQLMQALADAGISLGDTSVGEQDAREFAAENARRGDGRDANDADDGQLPLQAVVQTRPRGLVDTFA